MFTLVIKSVSTIYNQITFRACWFDWTVFFCYPSPAVVTVGNRADSVDYQGCWWLWSVHTCTLVLVLEWHSSQLWMGFILVPCTPLIKDEAHGHPLCHPKNIFRPDGIPKAPQQLPPRVSSQPEPTNSGPSICLKSWTKPTSSSFRKVWAEVCLRSILK